MRDYCLWLFTITALTFAIAVPARAEILTTGNVTPSNNNLDDPWTIVGGLTVSSIMPGTLTLTDGSMVAATDATIGYGSNAHGTLTIAGIDSELAVNDDLFIARSGVADIYINSGGALSGYRAVMGEYPGSFGSLTLSDPGSVWEVGNELFLGKAGNGALSITNNADATVNSVTRLAYELDSISTAEVIGVGSSLTVSNGLYVGWGGVATLDILQGASVTSNRGYVAHAVGSTGAALVSGSGSSWLTNGFIVGEGGEGGLIVEDGAVVTGYNATIGRNKNSMGVLTVRGMGSHVDLENGLVVGERGTGVLNIEHGATVNNQGRTSVGSLETGVGRIVFQNGVLNTHGLAAAPNELLGTGTIETTGLVSDIDLVFDQTHGFQQQVRLQETAGQDITINLDVSDPAGAPLIGVGQRGVGSLTISDGMVLKAGYGLLAAHPTSVATATLSGIGTVWDVDADLTIGHGGVATLVTQGGAQIKANRINIAVGSGSSGSATVSGILSRWDVEEFLFVGGSGSGTLLIEDGGTVVSGFRVVVGLHGDAVGTVTLTGEGSSWWHTGVFNVGWSGFGTGTLNIDSGALLDIDGGLFLKSPQDVVNLTGGTLVLHGEWSARNPVAVINGGVFNMSDGRLEGADHIATQQPFIQTGGTLAPGNSIGQTNVFGDYTLTGGTIEIEIGGDDDAHDMLTVSGDISIGPDQTTFDLRPLGPMSAGTYTLIYTEKGTLSGMFEHVTGIAMYPGLVDVSYTANAVLVTLNWDFVPGDLDGDGFVGIADLNLILGNWNQNVTPYDLSAADVTGDGFVGIADLNAVLGNWNTGTPPPAEALALVPEPAALGVLSVGLLGVVYRRG